jgi:hypothetical protein
MSASELLAQTLSPGMVLWSYLDLLPFSSSLFSLFIDATARQNAEAKLESAARENYVGVPIIRDLL